MPVGTSNVTYWDLYSEWIDLTRETNNPGFNVAFGEQSEFSVSYHSR